MRHFLALVTFVSPQLNSTYTKDMVYTIRPGNRYLNAMAEVWVLEGKIEFIHDHNNAKLYGIGKVNDETFTQKTKSAWSSLWR